MKTITIEVLKDAANRLLFDLSEEEYQTLYSEFGVLTTQMKTIADQKDLAEYEPMTFPFKECVTSYLREDEPSEPYKPEEALKNAGSKKDGQIKLPKVVG